MPKGVINTHRMLCCNQQMIAQIFGFLEDEPSRPPRLAPLESHLRRQSQYRHRSLQRRQLLHMTTASPAPPSSPKPSATCAKFPPPFISMSPKATKTCSQLCAPRPQLRENFFRHLRLLFYAGAGLSQPVWDAYRYLALANLRRTHHHGHRPRLHGNRSHGHSNHLGNRSRRSDRHPHSRRRSQTRSAR